MAKKPTKTKAVTVHPQVTLQSRPGDVDLSPEELAELELFSQLSGNPPEFAAFPGSIVLRRYRRGEIICRQGDSGATAFYVLTTRDMAAIRRLSRQQLQQAEAELAAAPADVAAAQQALQEAQAALDQEKQAAQEAEAAVNQAKSGGAPPQQIAQLQKAAKLLAAAINKQQAVVATSAEALHERQRRLLNLPARIDWLRENAAALASSDNEPLQADQAPQSDAAEPHRVASVVLSTSRDGRPRRAGLFGRLLRKSAAPPAGPAAKAPQNIQVDAPTPVNAASGVAPIYAGEIFGEMSCIMHTPRSATIVADADCCLLEFLRNILDHVQKDPGFKARLEPIYRRRVMKTDLKRLAILQDFGENTEQGLDLLQEHAELCSFAPGEAICDEGDPSDAVYLVRGGIVQVLKELSLTTADLLDPAALCRDLSAADDDGSTSSADAAAAARRKIFASLDPELQALARRLAQSKAPAEDQGVAPPAAEMAAALNRLIRDRSFLAAPELRPVIERDEIYIGAQNEVLNRGEWTPPAQLLAARNADRQKKVTQRIGAVFLQEKLAGRLKDQLAAQSEEQIKQQMRNRDGAALLAEIVAKEIADNLQHHWTDHQIRVVGRLALEAVFPQRLAELRPRNVINYLSRGDIFGEIGVLHGGPRTATCIAYDHRGSASRPAATQTELVRINKQVFQRLKGLSPRFEQAVAEVETQRLARDERAQSRAAGAAETPITSLPDFDDLVQGRRLLLIDLDRCTRCGDCVTACINTHADGFTRLYLDGPRFDRFLIPSACRQCRDPACLIGCPVGSIQRGAGGEIQIRDWCIGCSLCAQQCPYDAIQMQDIGIIPEWSPGWRFLPARALSQGDEQSGKWTRGGYFPYNDRGWIAGIAPFEWDLDFSGQLEHAAAHNSQAGRDVPERVYFRYRFHAAKAQCAASAKYKLALVSQSAGLSAWINGAAIELQAGRSGAFDARLTGDMLRPGANVLAASVELPVKPGETVLSARLDTVTELNLAALGGEAEAKLVSDRAVVCDLCTSLPSGQPACVALCPHDAAFRIDALTDLPRLLSGSTTSSAPSR